MFFKKVYKHFLLSFFLIGTILGFGNNIGEVNSPIYFFDQTPNISNVDYYVESNSITTNFEVEGMEESNVIGYQSQATQMTSMIKKSYWNTTLETVTEIYDALSIPMSTRVAIQSLGGDLDQFISPVLIPVDSNGNYRVVWQTWNQQWNDPNILLPSTPNTITFQRFVSENEYIHIHNGFHFLTIFSEDSIDYDSDKVYVVGSIASGNTSFREWEFLVNNEGYFSIRAIGTQKYLQNYKDSYFITDELKGISVSDTPSYFQFAILKPEVFSYSNQTTYFNENGFQSAKITSLTFNKPYIILNKFTLDFEDEILHLFETKDLTTGTISNLNVIYQSFDFLEFKFSFNPGTVFTNVEYSIDDGLNWIDIEIPQELNHHYNVFVYSLQENTNYTILLRSISQFGEIDRLSIQTNTTLKYIGTISQAEVINVFYDSIEFQYWFIFNGLETNLQYSVDGEKSWITTEIVINSTDKYIYKINNLTPETSYDLRIRTMSQDCFGETITPRGGDNIATKQKLGKISSLNIVNATYNSILVGFDYLEGDGNTLFQYSTNNINWEFAELLDISGDKLFNFNNLNEGEDYILYLRTFNDDVFSPVSFTTGSTTKRLSGQVHSSKVINVEPTLIEIEYIFIPGDLETNLQYSIDDGNSWISLRTFQPSNFYSNNTYVDVIYDLTPKQTYTLQLRTQAGDLTTTPIVPVNGEGIKIPPHPTEYFNALFLVNIGYIISIFLMITIIFYIYKKIIKNTKYF